MEQISPKYEEHFVGFIDLLGFKEVSDGADEVVRQQILELLLSLADWRGEFDHQSNRSESGIRSSFRPAVSMFSDHIVVSYPVARVYVGEGMHEERLTASLILDHFNYILTMLAGAALHIGLLIRGAATIGRVYHAKGVVFGEALVEAYRLESETSVYPRVLLSSKILNRKDWTEEALEIALRGEDGLYHFDYFKRLVVRSSPAGKDYNENIRNYYSDVVRIISSNLAQLEGAGRLKELAKWTWFAHHFRKGLERLNPNLLSGLGISTDETYWKR